MAGASERNKEDLILRYEGRGKKINERVAFERKKERKKESAGTKRKIVLLREPKSESVERKKDHIFFKKC